MSATVPITPSTLRYANELLRAFEVGNADWEIRPRLGKYFFQELVTPGQWKLDDVSPFEARRILAPELEAGVVSEAIRLMRENVPAFKRLVVRDSWGGVLSATPDTLPVIGPVEQIPGVLVATGFSDGLTLAPAVGAAIADLVAGRAPAVDLKPFEYSRFT
jgi:glycine/D-amino acid oxidase-like deaminating enzyme